MSYQVLARKYRPASFEELEGQEHVLRALVNALENDRLHHAYLFTGTRGVGKTTIARILARCLNCEKGISAKPCGECSTCLEIAEGRSVDLIEVDAASRTKVEDTRELLDNVQYMPTRDRFKVYLIDEVHMLSTHSFNALLKTLEEPPEHVKFLLATTDPKKLPVTVLSRCLQFNLKNLSPERIVTYLQKILPVEGIEFEEPALWLLGRAADGSMRDALSLTDQAISFGNNSVREDDVKLMLGSIDQKEVYALVEGLIRQDAKAIVEKINQLAEHAPDYSGLLAEILAVLHRVALAQAVPDGIDNSQGDRELVLAVAEALTPEDVQLFYQIGLVGQRDLPFAPNLKAGFEMILLRMLAFTPFSDNASQDESSQKKTVKFERTTSALTQAISSQAQTTSTQPSPSAAEDSDLIDFGDSDSLSNGSSNNKTAAPVEAPAVGSGIKAGGNTGRVSLAERVAKAEAEKLVKAEIKIDPPVEAVHEVPTGVLTDVLTTADSAEAELVPTTLAPTASATTMPATTMPAPTAAPIIALDETSWVDVLPKLKLSGVTLSVASNCCVLSVTDSGCTLQLDETHASLWNKTHESRIESALSKHYDKPFKLIFEVGKTGHATPAKIEADRRAAAQIAAVKLIEGDAKVKQLIESFDGTLDKDTITARQ
ncbi:MAG: DNA polymerase-3 subunit gamma/tau [Candidatus Azotimanducaceae bacterium]|jgi:DNA polymerase-3 subunit gamma/tau